MQLAAFQLPAIPKSQSFSTQSRAVPLSTHRPWNWSLPSKLLQPPRSKPPTSSGGRKRQSVAAWLTGHADVIVLSTATVASPAPLRLYGSLTQVLASIRALRISVLYVHMRAVSPVDLTVLRSCQVVPVLVGASGPVAVPAPCVALAMASVAPLLTERKGDAVTHFFDHGIESDAPLRPEVGRLDNTPLTDRITAWITRVYLPQGYPNTTTPDYISFTKFRTLQNLASAVMQVISTKALLYGLGLGKKVAAGAAATSWVLKDGASYLVKIGYGGVFGSKFDDDPKSWRIAADIVEDVGGAIEILTPLFARSYFLPLASLAVCLRGMSLMTGTATRHVVYRSLAAGGMQNTGDIATKGESQGVTMKMIGLGVGIVVSSKIGQNYYALLTAYTLLASIHIAANWKSVQCVQFSFLNKQRASILIESHLKGLNMPSPYDVSHHEKIVLPPWRGFQPNVKVGVGVKEAKLTSARFAEAANIFKGERFLILTVPDSDKINILLREDASSKDTLRAYYTVKKYLKTKDRSQEQLIDSLKDMKKNMTSFEKLVEKAGWDTRHMLIADDQACVSW